MGDHLGMRFWSQRVGALVVGFAAGAAFGSFAGAVVPSAKRFTPPGLGVTFTLPADWGQDHAQPHVRFFAAGPGHIAVLQVISGRTSDSLGRQATNFVAYQRQIHAKSAPTV